MDELKNKIETLNLFDKEDVVSIFNDIYQISDKEDINKENIDDVIDFLFTRLKEKVSERTYSSYDSIKNTVDSLKRIYRENGYLESSEVYQLFNKYNIDTDTIVNEYVAGIDAEISTIERELSEEIVTAKEQNITVQEYIQSEIDKLKDYDEKIVECDRAIEEIKQVLENGSLSDEELKNKIEKYKNEVTEIWNKGTAEGNGLSEEEEKRYSELDKLIRGLEKEQAKRKDNKYRNLSDEELKNKIDESEREIETIRENNNSLEKESLNDIESKLTELNHQKDEIQYEIDRRENSSNIRNVRNGIKSKEKLIQVISEAENKEFISKGDLEIIIEKMKEFNLSSDSSFEKFNSKLNKIKELKIKYETEDLRLKLSEINVLIGEMENKKNSLLGNELSEDDKKKISELENLIKELKQEQNKRKVYQYRNLTDKDLQEKIEEYKQELRKRLFVANTVNNEMTDEERKLNEDKIAELDKLIKELEAELEKRKKDPLRTANIESDRELKEKLDRLIGKRENFVSEKKNKFDELNKKLNKANRLDELKNMKENFKAPKKIERKEKNKKLLLKSLIALGGLGTGLVLSSVPGVGVIRMVAATAKLGNSAINLWTKKFPEGKVARIVNASKEKYAEKFGTMANKFKDKHPKIAAGVSNVKNKIKSVLANKNVNLFIDSVAAGYVVGNIIELFTGKTVLEHAKGLFDEGDVSNVVTSGNQLPDKNSTVPSEPTQKPITRPIVKPENLQPSVDLETNVGFIDNVPNNILDFDLEVGGTYDLSGLTQGFVSSDATQPVNLMTSAARNVTLDKIVNGRVHFIQENGLGMAWYDLEEVKEYLAEMAKVSGRGRL